ncbi:hypothetical protein HDU86_006368 [Geranomyces michiganensis]|nr:hypothetical protein HDU86_006368 [Geranomyces michiganensis]
MLSAYLREGDDSSIDGLPSMLGARQRYASSSSSIGERASAIHLTGALSLLRKGKFGKQKSKSRVILCAPRLTEDLFEILTAMYPRTTPATTRGLRPSPHVALALGRLSLAAIRGPALMVIVPESPDEVLSDPIYIDMTSVREIKDERDLRETCTFALAMDEGKFLFKAEFSVDYLNWIGAIKQVLKVSPRSPAVVDEHPIRGWRAASTPQLATDGDRRGRGSMASNGSFGRRRGASVDAFSFSNSPARQNRADVIFLPNPPRRPAPPIPSSAEMSSKSSNGTRDGPARSQSIDRLRIPLLLYNEVAQAKEESKSIRADRADCPDYFVMGQPEADVVDNAASVPRTPLRLPSVRRVSWHSGAERSNALAAGDEPTRYDLAQDWGMPQLLVQSSSSSSLTSEPEIMVVRSSPLPRPDKKKGVSGPPVAYRRGQGHQAPPVPQQEREEVARSGRHYGLDQQPEEMREDPHFTGHQESIQDSRAQEQHSQEACHGEYAIPLRGAPYVANGKSFPELPQQLYVAQEPTHLRRDSGIGSSTAGSSTNFSFVTSAPSDNLFLSETSRVKQAPTPLPRFRDYNVHYAASDLDRSAPNSFHQQHQQQEQQQQHPRARHGGASLDISTTHSRPTPPPRSRRAPTPLVNIPQNRPVSLAGSPSGPPGRQPEVPLISLAHPGGPRVWSQRRQKKACLPLGGSPPRLATADLDVEVAEDDADAENAGARHEDDDGVAEDDMDVELAEDDADHRKPWSAARRCGMQQGKGD